MASIPFAFSVHHFINSVGADAGFASIIGLAILVLLYFAQARETASLRDHAYEAAERIHDLEDALARVQAAAAAQPSPALVPPNAAPVPSRAMPAGAPVPSAVSAMANSAPAAPAGVGAPALTAATKLIPTAAPAFAAALAPERPLEPRKGAPPLTPGPATVAAGAAVGGAAAGANGSSSGAAPSATIPPRQATSPPRVQMRSGQTAPPRRRGAPPPRLREPERRGASRRIIGLVLAVLALIAIVAVLIVVTSGSGGHKTVAGSTTSTTNTLTSRRTAKRSAVNPASVTVAVLNGTSTTGLAGRVAQKLTGLGYKPGGAQTATDQTHATTIVEYLVGFKADAVAVAKSLKLSASAVQPVDQSSQGVACPSGQTCADNVIVTVGADLVNIQ